jgi:putative tricarboxylic transport membrane protein
MSRMKRALKDPNAVPSLLLLIMAVLVIVEAVRMDVGSLTAPGPGLMFFGAASILAVIAAHLLIKSFWAGVAEKLASPPEGRSYRVIVTLAAIGAYIFILIPVGYVVSTFALLAVLFNLARSNKKGAMVMAALGVSLVTYFVFDKLLGVQLPMGWIPF